MSDIYVKPRLLVAADGPDLFDPADPTRTVLVRDPIDLAPLPATGAWKPRTPFWMRRLRAGDVIEATPPAAAPPPADPAPAPVPRRPKPNTFPPATAAAVPALTE